VADPLANLAASGQLLAEPTSANEMQRFLASARRLLKDASLRQLSAESRFMMAYSAAHTLSLAALRANGYRPSQSRGHRALVFQSLAHTISAQPALWATLNRYHTKRNKSEYEAVAGFTEAEAEELRGLAAEVEVLLIAWLKARRPDLGVG